MDFDIFSEDIESVFIEVRNKVKNIIVAVVYRPPSHNPSNFMSQLQESLIKIVQEKKECIIMGDVNVDFMKKMKIRK